MAKFRFWFEDISSFLNNPGIVFCSLLASQNLDISQVKIGSRLEFYCNSYSLFSYFLTFFKKQITAQRREVFVSGDRNCFHRAVARRRDEIGDEKHEEIRRWSRCLFQKNPKVFEQRLFAIFNYKNSHGF